MDWAPLGASGTSRPKTGTGGSSSGRGRLVEGVVEADLLAVEVSSTCLHGRHDARPPGPRPCRRPPERRSRPCRRWRRPRRRPPLRPPRSRPGPIRGVGGLRRPGVRRLLVVGRFTLRQSKDRRDLARGRPLPSRPRRCAHLRGLAAAPPAGRTRVGVELVATSRSPMPLAPSDDGCSAGHGAICSARSPGETGPRAAAAERHAADEVEVVGTPAAISEGAATPPTMVGAVSRPTGAPAGMSPSSTRHHRPTAGRGRRTRS